MRSVFPPGRWFNIRTAVLITRGHYCWLWWFLFGAAQQRPKQKLALSCLLYRASFIHTGKLRHRQSGRARRCTLQMAPAQQTHSLEWPFGDTDYFYNGGLQATHISRRLFAIATTNVSPQPIGGGGNCQARPAGRLGEGKGCASAVLRSLSVSSRPVHSWGCDRVGCITPAPHYQARNRI